MLTERYIERINAMTPEELTRFFETYVQDDFPYIARRFDDIFALVRVEARYRRLSVKGKTWLEVLDKARRRWKLRSMLRRGTTGRGGSCCS